jgi:hypothetical protein
MHAILNFCEDLPAGRHLIDLIAGWLAQSRTSPAAAGGVSG